MSNAWIRARALPLLMSAVVGVGALVGCADDPADEGASPETTVDAPDTTADSTSESTTTTEATDGTAAPPDTSPPATDDLCRILSADEAEAILGGPVTELNNTSTDGPLGLSGSCGYRATSDTDPVAVQTLVNVVVLGTTITIEQFEQELFGDQPDAAEVTGVGERALLLPGGDSLIVFDGGTVVSVQILIARQPVDQSVLADVATTALDRL